jgi:hypothetical protein
VYTFLQKVYISAEGHTFCRILTFCRKGYTFLQKSAEDCSASPGYAPTLIRSQHRVEVIDTC